MRNWVKDMIYITYSPHKKIVNYSEVLAFYIRSYVFIRIAHTKRSENSCERVLTRAYTPCYCMCVGMNERAYGNSKRR